VNIEISNYLLLYSIFDLKRNIASIFSDM